MAIEEHGIDSMMRSGMYSLMGIFEIIPVLQEISLEKKYNEAKSAREKAAFHPEIIARHAKHNPMGLFWANQDTLDPIRQKLIQQGIPFAIVEAGQIKSPDIRPGGPFVFVVRDIDQARVEKIIREVLQQQEKDDPDKENSQEEEAEEEEEFERERNAEDETENQQENQTSQQEEQPDIPDFDESEDEPDDKKKKTGQKKKKGKTQGHRKKSYKDAHSITQEQIRRQMDDIRQLELDRRALDRERLLQQESADYYKKRTELNDRDREARRQTDEARERQIKELERRVEERRKITEARNDKFSSQGYTGWKDFAADAQERARQSNEEALRNGHCYQGLDTDDYLKRNEQGGSVSYSAYTQEERIQHLDRKYGTGSDVKIQLNGYARERESLEIARQKEEILRAKERYAGATGTEQAAKYKEEYDLLKQQAHVDEEKISTWDAKNLHAERSRLEESIKARTEYLNHQKVTGYDEYGSKIAERVKTIGIGTYAAGSIPKPDSIKDVSGHSIENFQNPIYDARKQESRASEKDWVSQEERLKAAQTYQKLDKKNVYGTTVSPGSEVHKRLSTGSVYAMTWKQVQTVANAEATRSAMMNPDALIRSRNPQYSNLTAVSANTYSHNQIAYAFSEDHKVSAPDTPVTKRNLAPVAGGSFHVTPGIDAGNHQTQHAQGGSFVTNDSQKLDSSGKNSAMEIEHRNTLSNVLMRKRNNEQAIDFQRVRARNQIAKAINSRYFTMAVASGASMLARSTYEGTEAAPVIDKIEGAAHLGYIFAKRKLMEMGAKTLTDENPMVQSAKNSLLHARANMAMRMDSEELAKYADQLHISKDQLEKAQTDVHKMENLLEMSMTQRTISKEDMLEMADALGIAGCLAKDGIVGQEDALNFMKQMNNGYVTVAQQGKAYAQVMESMDFMTTAKAAEEFLKGENVNADSIKDFLKQKGFSDESIKNLEGKFGDNDALLKAIQSECAGKQRLTEALMSGKLDPADLRELLVKNGVSAELLDKLGGTWNKTGDLTSILAEIGLSQDDIARLTGALQNIQLTDTDTMLAMLIEMNGGRVTDKMIQDLENAGMLNAEWTALMNRRGNLQFVTMDDLKGMSAVPGSTIQDRISGSLTKATGSQKINDAIGANTRFSIMGLFRHVRSLFLKLGQSTDAVNGFNQVTSYATRMYTITKVSYRLLYNGLFKYMHKFGIGPFKNIKADVLAHPLAAANNALTGGIRNKIASVMTKPLQRITNNRIARVANHVLHPGQTALKGASWVFQKVFGKKFTETALGGLIKKASVKVAAFVTDGALATVCFWIVVIIVVLMMYENIDLGGESSDSDSYSAAYVSAADGKDAFAQEVIDMLRGYTDDFIDEINNAKYNRGMYSTMIDYNTNESVGNYENGAYKIVFRGPDGEPIENIRDVDLNNSKDIISMASVFIPTAFQKPGEGATDEQKEAYEKDKEHFKDYCSFLWAASHQISIEEYHPGNATNDDADDTSGLITDATTGKCEMDYAMYGDKGAGVNWWLGAGKDPNTFKKCTTEQQAENNSSLFDITSYPLSKCVEKPAADPCTHGHWITQTDEKYNHQGCYGHYSRRTGDYHTCADYNKENWDVHENTYRRVWVCDGHMGAVVYVTIGKVSRMPNFGAATDWDFSGGESFGGYGGGGLGIGINGTEEPFQAQGFPTLTDAQLSYIAGMCISEQGACATNPTTMRYQASLMANVYELYGKRKGLGIWDYLKLLPSNGGWFATSTHTNAYKNAKRVSDECMEALRDVLINGNRITHANEQGTLNTGNIKGGFTKAVYNGQTYTGSDLSRLEIWVPGQTLIYTSAGQECIFLGFPGGYPAGSGNQPVVDPFALIKN